MNQDSNPNKIKNTYQQIKTHNTNEFIEQNNFSSNLHYYFQQDYAGKNQVYDSIIKELDSLNSCDQQQIITYQNTHSQMSHQGASAIGNLEQAYNNQYLHQGFFETIKPAPAPKTIAELIENCNKIAGKSVSELAQIHNVELIDSLTTNRGWLGNLIEISLGAYAGSKPTQDFMNLGVELKTLAINENGRAVSDIFISSLPLNSFMLQDWANSHLFYKLQHILFIPVESNSNVELKDRKIGNGKFWKPNDEQLKVLQDDFKQVMELLTTQEFAMLTNNLGTALTVKVKALNSKQTNNIQDLDGFNQNLAPLSFYIKRSFVQQIVEQLFK